MAWDSEPAFERQVVIRAWTSAWAFFKSKLRDAILFVILFAAGGAVYWRLYGFPATKDQVVPVLIFTIGPMVALWVLLFIWHLWLAPSALAYEAARHAAFQPATAASPSLHPPKVNWAPWKKRSEYTIVEFANILAKSEPAGNSFNSDGSAFNSLLIDAANNGKLDYVKQYNTSYTGDKHLRKVDSFTRITRDKALAWAAANDFSTDHVR